MEVIKFVCFFLIVLLLLLLLCFIVPRVQNK